MKQFGILSSVLILLAAASAAGQTARASSVKSYRAFVYHGKIVRPDGTVPTGSVPVTLKILSPEPSLCLLWAETQNVALDNGAFALEIGHGVNRLAGAAGGAASDFKQAFINNTALVISSANCAQGTSYTPGAADDRLFTASFKDGATSVDVTAMPIKSVPFALQAEEIGGFGLANLAKISGAGSSVTYTPDEIQTLKDFLGGNLEFDAKSRVVKNVANPTAGGDAANKAYVDAALSAVTISDGSLSLTKLQNIATQRLLGRSTAGAGAPEAISIGSGLTLSGGTLSAVSGGGGTVTDVQVGGGPLSVSNGQTVPVLSIAQANTTTAGYLSAADWNTFNNKQPAGSYLTSITSGNVTTALGFTPVSNNLTSGQVFIGNGSNVAAGGFFGIGQMRNNVGTLQMPTACTSAQTLTWNAVNDVLTCTNIAIGTSNIANLAITDAKINDVAWTKITGKPTTLSGYGITDALRVPSGVQPTVAEDGKTLRWNNTSGQFEWFTAGAAGAGIATFNGSSQSSQSFATPGTTGTAPAWSTNAGAGVHTLNIPMASGAGVTAGLLSKTDYDAFNSKQASIGFTPVNRAGDTMTGTLNLPANGLNVGTSQIAMSGGNVGFGTASPGQRIDIFGSTYSDAAIMVRRQDNAGTGAGPGLDFQSYLGTPGTPGAQTTASKGLGQINFYGADQNGAQAQSSVRLNAVAEENISTTAAGGALRIMTTAPGGTSLAEKMRVTGTGHVGVGTTSPTEKLEVVGGKIKAPEYCIGASCITAWPSGGGGSGTVTNVSVSGLPLSVANQTTTPQISIAQANTTTAGYLSAADWNTFNNKQPAGAYLTSITSGNVTTALGFTPVSNALPSGQVFLGNGSNVAAGSFFGIGQMRNNLGTLQMPTACTAAQTLTWNAVNDVLACTNIAISAGAVTGLGALAAKNSVSLSTADVTGSLGDSKITDLAWSKLTGKPTTLGGYGITDAVVKGGQAGAFSLGTSDATAVSLMSGGVSRLTVAEDGNVGIGTTSPSNQLEVAGIIASTSGGFLFPDGTMQTSATASSESFWVQSGNNIYAANSGNIGIGTSSPQSQLTISPPGAVAVKTRVFTSSGSWTVPTGFGVTSITVEVWGAGGGGAGSASNTYAGGGGGGGGYSKKSFGVSEGTTFSLQVGTGGAGGYGNANGAAGTASWFGATATVCAPGGMGGVKGPSGAGGAGSSNGCVGAGDIVRSGGSGGAGTVSSNSGGGGGAGGETGNGGSASGASPGSGNSGSGNGGSGGGPANFAGGLGGALGGGGGGAYRAASPTLYGGNGGAGQVKITWTETGVASNPLQVLNPLGSTALIVSSSGKVGIGTVSPSAPLSVNGGVQLATDNSDSLTSCDSSNAGKMVYAGGGFFGCNGFKWQRLAASDVSDSASGNGYFVMLPLGYESVNFGGLAEANLKCLNGLVGSNWKGRDDAAFRGLLKTSKVFAFLCDNSLCQNLAPNTTYQFATASWPVDGGDVFTTDASGAGPGDTVLWRISTKFCHDNVTAGSCTNYTIPSGRTAGTTTAWGLTPSGNSCSNWTSNTSGFTVTRGAIANTGSSRWAAGTSACNAFNNYALICYVNP